ncbi:oligosaccharide flippase family protein [Maribellus comscasis]|uniref:Oligosaccharide flippase family protein n=1 Tax=Maribellus comscasis TaxID=2681766 RepID=A0A6I6JQQ8_9BACT|nr:oligosaccharide flippase family protein [Maribellus comscasis]QGY45335.1 oligosaccharide flippase family protein [Maribellus comscasis]
MPALRESINKVFQSEFYRNILSLFSGMFLARLFPALFALIIVRIYSPENFGLFVLYITIASTLSIISTGKYENAIILAETKTEKRHIFWLAQKINVLVNVVAALGIFVYILVEGVELITSVLQLVLIPLYSFFFAAVQLLRNVLISNKQFKKLSFLEITRSLTTGILQCLFFAFPETGLFMGAFLAQLLIYFVYARMIPEAQWNRKFLFTKEERNYGRRYINFPKFSVASEIFNFLSSQLPVFLIKPFFGSTILGLYSFPHRYVSTPVQLLSTSVSRVYIQKARSLKNNVSDLSRLTFSLFKKQFLIGIIPFTVMTLWGQAIFRVVFGAEWEFSGFLAQLIAPWLFVVMLISPLSAIMIVMEKQKISMFFNILLMAFRIAGLLIGGIILKDISWAIGLYSFTGFVFFVALGAYSLKLAGVKPGDIMKFVFKILIVILLPLILLRIWM